MILTSDFIVDSAATILAALALLVAISLRVGEDHGDQKDFGAVCTELLNSFWQAMKNKISKLQDRRGDDSVDKSASSRLIDSVQFCVTLIGPKQLKSHPVDFEAVSSQENSPQRHCYSSAGRVALYLTHLSNQPMWLRCLTWVMNHWQSSRIAPSSNKDAENQSEDSGFALICRACGGHSGCASVDEFSLLSWRCKHCAKFHPARSTLIG